MFLRRIFKSFPKWVGDLFTPRRLSVAILNAVVDRQEAEITRLLTRNVEREKEMVVLRELKFKWETLLRERLIYRKICLFIQSERGRRFIETIFSVIMTKKYCDKKGFGDCDKKV